MGHQWTVASYNVLVWQRLDPPLPAPAAVIPQDVTAEWETVAERRWDGFHTETIVVRSRFDGSYLAVQREEDTQHAGLIAVLFDSGGVPFARTEHLNRHGMRPVVPKLEVPWVGLAGDRWTRYAFDRPTVDGVDVVVDAPLECVREALMVWGDTLGNYCLAERGDQFLTAVWYGPLCPLDAPIHGHVFALPTRSVSVWITPVPRVFYPVSHITSLAFRLVALDHHRTEVMLRADQPLVPLLRAFSEWSRQRWPSLREVETAAALRHAYTHGGPTPPDLTEKDAVLVTLYRQGKTAKEIAEVLSWAPTTVSRRISELRAMVPGVLPYRNQKAAEHARVRWATQPLPQK